jgi:hypothetical protein
MRRLAPLAFAVVALAPLAFAVVALALAGCARPVGDFGRAAPDPLHDTIMPFVGNARANAAKESVSSFNFSDEEKEMRDRVWRYLVSPHAFDWSGDVAAEWQRTRLAAPSTKPLPVDRYYRWLHGERFASSPVRYGRLGDDVTTDLSMLPQVFAAICAVENIDRRRGLAANEIDSIEERMRADAAARQAENRMVVGSFARALANREASYNYALDHLLVETPHAEARAVNAGLTRLGIYAGAAARGDFCSEASLAQRGAGETAIPSRVLRSQGLLGS